MFGVQWRVCHKTRECMLVPSMADYGVVQYIHLARNTQQVLYVICKVKLAKCKIFRNFCFGLFNNVLYPARDLFARASCTGGSWPFLSHCFTLLSSQWSQMGKVNCSSRVSNRFVSRTTGVSAQIK